MQSFIVGSVVGQDASSRKACIVDAGGRQMIGMNGGGPPTYLATTLITFANPTLIDVFCLTASTTKDTRVIGLKMTGTAATAGVFDVIVTARSTATAGGTTNALAPVALDPADAASTAAFLYYTAAGGVAGAANGTVRGTIGVQKMGFPLATGAANLPLMWDFTKGKALRLRAGTADSFCVGFNNQTIATGILDFELIWTEE